MFSAVDAEADHVYERRAMRSALQNNGGIGPHTEAMHRQFEGSVDSTACSFQSEFILPPILQSKDTNNINCKRHDFQNKSMTEKLRVAEIEAMSIYEVRLQSNETKYKGRMKLKHSITTNVFFSRR